MKVNTIKLNSPSAGSASKGMANGADLFAQMLEVGTAGAANSGEDATSQRGKNNLIIKEDESVANVSSVESLAAAGMILQSISPPPSANLNLEIPKSNFEFQEIKPSDNKRQLMDSSKLVATQTLDLSKLAASALSPQTIDATKVQQVSTAEMATMQNLKNSLPNKLRQTTDKIPAELLEKQMPMNVMANNLKLQAPEKPETKVKKIAMDAKATRLVAEHQDVINLNVKKVNPLKNSARLAEFTPLPKSPALEVAKPSVMNSKIEIKAPAMLNILVNHLQNFIEQKILPSITAANTFLKQVTNQFLDPINKPERGESIIESMQLHTIDGNATQNVHEATMNLYPPELGRVLAKIKIEKHATNVDFIADNLQVKAAILQKLPQLAEHFKEMGLKNVVLDVAVNVTSDQSNPQHSSRQMPAFLPDEELTIPQKAATALTKEPKENALVDIYA